MDNFDEIKKFKELLDSGVINEEEFTQKKKELLSIEEPETEEINPIAEPQKEKKHMDSQKKKTILAVAIATVVIFVAVFGIKTAFAASQTAKRNAAVIKHIEPIMTKYGISDYAVGDIHDGLNFFKVYAEGFESLTNGKAMEMLKALDAVKDMDDPCGGKKISFSTVNIFPGKNADYCYYRVSTTWVKAGISNYKKPGIYSSYGMQCVYECDN